MGYVQGAGDFIPEFLRIAGIQVDVLKDEDFYGNLDELGVNGSQNKLLQYDAIVLGVRANNTEKNWVVGCLFYGLMQKPEVIW